MKTVNQAAAQAVAESHTAPSGQPIADNDKPAAGGGLDDLLSQAQQVEGSAVEAQHKADAEREVKQAADTAAELLGALEMARMMVGPLLTFWPKFGDVWSDKQLKEIADSGALVMARHGWTMGGMMAEFGPYLALLGATVPPAWATYIAIKAERDRLEREARGQFVRQRDQAHAQATSPAPQP